MKFSFAELDHRIQAFETDVGGLKARAVRFLPFVRGLGSKRTQGGGVELFNCPGT